MNDRRFLLLALATGALLVPASAANAVGEPAPPPAPTTVPDDPFGLPDVDPVDGGPAIPDPEVQIVDRWTITPEGSNDPNAISTRSELAYTGEPGGVIEDGVTVFNLGNTPLTFHLYGTDAVNQDDGTFSLLARDSNPTGVGTWVSLGQENITISPGMAATIPVTIAIPADARPGDHVGGIVASAPAIGVADDGNQVELDRGVGTRLYIRVAGPLEPDLAIEDIGVDYGTDPNPLSGTTTLTFRVHNRGNVRLDGTYAVSVAGPFGIGREEAAPVEFTELLPGQSIEVIQEFDDIAALGWVNANVEVESRGAAGADAGDRASSVALALPVSVLLLMLLAGATWFASRRIRAHRETPPEPVRFVSSEPTSEPEREPQLS